MQMKSLLEIAVYSGDAFSYQTNEDFRKCMIFEKSQPTEGNTNDGR